jgi:hypothetical protein
VLDAEIDVLKELGVIFRCGVEIGKDITIAQLREQGYDAIYLAVGAQKSASLGIPGEDLEKVWGIDAHINLGFCGTGIASVNNTYIDKRTGDYISHSDVVARLKNTLQVE